MASPVSVSRAAVVRAIEAYRELGILPASPDAILSGINERDRRGITYLLTPDFASPKLSHNGGHVDIVSGILYLRARTAGGRGNLCVASDIGCEDCYGEGGRASVFASINKARQKRVDFFADDCALFMNAIIGEVLAIRVAAGRDKLAAVRLNGLSDIAWERVPAGDAAHIMEGFPGVRFWEYTRVPGRITPYGEGKLPSNLDLTFSLGADNDRIARRALSYGMKVAAVFRQPFTAESWHGFPVINGDLHDFRFLESGPAIVALKAKGPARTDTSGFVRETDSVGFDMTRVPRFGRSAS